MKKLLSLALALLLLAVMLPVTAMAAPTYPDGVDFENVSTVSYTHTYGGTTVKEGSAADHPAVIAYVVDASGNVKYAADLSAAVLDGASVIYCKENANIAFVVAHIPATKGLTIYANRADFNNQDIGLGYENRPNERGESNYAGDITLKIYDANNLYVWGYSPADGVTQTVIMENCHNEGTSSTNQTGRMFYISGKTGTINVTLNNCSVKNCDSPVYMNTNGSLSVENCSFTNCAVPININYKATGTRNDTIKDCEFINCGNTDDANLSGYSAPIRFVNSGNGSLDATIENNTFTGTVGNNGDILLGDQRDGQSSFNVNAKIVTKQDVTVKSGNSENQSTFEVKANTSVKANAVGKQPEVIRDNAPIIIYTPTGDTPKTDDQKNPTTGANDLVAVAVAAAALALAGSAIILRKD